MKKIIVSALILSVGFWQACGGSSSGGDGGGGGGGGDGTTEISNTVPADIILSSPTASVQATPSLSDTAVVKADAGSDYETKREELDALITGTGECSYEFQAMGGLSLANCYGPRVTCTNFPDVPPKDIIGGGDLGIWNSTNLNDASEACSAAQMNSVVEFAASRVDNFIYTMGAIACAGAKGGKTAPAIDDSIDLTSDITEFVTISDLTITSATIERLDDDGTNPVYKFTVAGTAAIGSITGDVSFIIKHIPTATDNSTYRGKISFSLSYTDPSEPRPGNCDDESQGFDTLTAEGSVQAGMILYEKTSSSSITYEMNMAEFCGADTDPFDSDNNIDPADVLSVSNLDGWGNTYNYGLFNINPEDGTGTVAYAWQAGYGDGAARTLNLTVTSEADDSASGDAYFGFGPGFPTSTATNRGSIERMYCNWGGDPRNGFAQHQELLRTAGGTVFGTVHDDITFAPTNNCNYGGGTFTYVSDIGTMTNDNDDGHLIVDDLIEISTEMDFTRPTPPTDVGG